MNERHWHCSSCGLSFQVGEWHNQILDPWSKRVIGCHMDESHTMSETTLTEAMAKADPSYRSPNTPDRRYFTRPEDKA